MGDLSRHTHVIYKSDRCILARSRKSCARKTGENLPPAKCTMSQDPDIEKALVAWAKKFQRNGIALDDKTIMEKAIFWAEACRLPEGKKPALSSDWLENYKQDNNLLFACSPSCANTIAQSAIAVLESKVGNKKACTTIKRGPAILIKKQCKAAMHPPSGSVETSGLLRSNAGGSPARVRNRKLGTRRKIFPGSTNRPAFQGA